MNLLLKIIITSVIVLILANFLPGVYVNGFTTALIVAVVLGLLNIFIKPILVLLTLPVTVLTLGLFLLIINALMIVLCSQIVDGFKVETFLTAIIFSVLLSVSQSIMNGLLGISK
ncbi:putative membrane protein [Flavobacterium tiangeerense]|uniref:Membrane protein n=1 Tax=Flavobacterium tiangeerense TaxID=459471 RepID=A0ABY3FMM8_9FLAO|nr:MULTISPECIES: phage holin family protein [Flavobacterium]QZK91363.1 phage holin family protein [Flavobacterium sp. CHNK8]TWI02276.1 putative membrane protein [Flavobacterium tiangeerense]